MRRGDTDGAKQTSSRSSRGKLPLTQRQLEVIELVGHGMTNPEIAVELGISTATVKRHLERIYDRAGVRTRAGVAAKVLMGGPAG